MMEAVQHTTMKCIAERVCRVARPVVSHFVATCERQVFNSEVIAAHVYVLCAQGLLVGEKRSSKKLCIGRGDR